MSELPGRTYVALVHHPVLNREGKVVTTAVTNLDVHDIARSSRTYELAGYFVVTPITLQQQLVQEILSHWQGDYGEANEPRRQALSRLRVAPDLDTVVARVTEEQGRAPRLVATAARPAPSTVSAAAWREEMAGRPEPAVLMFGTGWGLAEPVFERADVRMEPIRGPGSYNHLSVRSAVAITLDRLFGER